MTRLFWIALGGLALGLGILGVALPLLPTTPFLLLAAFAFARSSERLHDWLIAHPRFGPMIGNWQREGAISRRAKRLAVVAMVAAFAISVAAGVSETVLIVQAIALTLAGLFVLTRPAPAAERRD